MVNQNYFLVVDFIFEKYRNIVFQMVVLEYEQRHIENCCFIALCDRLFHLLFITSIDWIQFIAESFRIV